MKKLQWRELRVVVATGVVPVAAALILLGLAACGSDSETLPVRVDPYPLPPESLRVETSGRPGATLHYALSGEPSTFNPVMVTESRARQLTYLTTATLLEFDQQHQSVRGGVTREWEVSADGRKVTLTLRDGVRFSDGEPLSAEDVLFTLEKVYEEGSVNPLKDSLKVGGRTFEAARLGDGRVEITFPEPYAAAEYLLTTVPILPRHRLGEEGKKIEEFWNLDTAPEEMAGLGPFVVADHQPGERTLLRRNPHYWRIDENRTRLPYLEELVVHYIEDRNSQLLRFQAGELDLLDYQLRPEDFLQLQDGDDPVQVYNAGPSSALTFCWFNLNTGNHPETGRPFVPAPKSRWFFDLNFRKAVNLAVSRDAIVKNVFLGQATAAGALVPASIRTWHVAGLQGYRYDPEQARRLLRESGFSWQKQGVTEQLIDARRNAVEFSIATLADDFWGRIAAILQQDLEKLGMRITIRQEEFRSVISRVMRSKDYDAALMALEFPYEPADQVGVLLSSSPMHFWNPAQKTPATEWEKRIDDLMFRQVTTLDRAQRQEMFREVQQILVDNLPMFPLVNKDALVAARPNLRNLKPVNLFPNGLWNVWELWLE